MKLSEVFGGFFKAAQEAGIEIEADQAAPLAKEEKADPPAAPDTSALEAQAKETAAQLVAAQAQIAALESQARDARFRALAADWTGETAAHLSIMAALGEDMPAFQAYVQQQKAVAEQLRQSKLFQDAGSAQAAGGGSAWAQMDAKARALMATTPGMTKAQAVVAVAENDPDLYRQYKQEM